MENATNLTVSEVEQEIPLIYTITYGVIFPLICIIGLFGNILTMIIICQEKKSTSSTKLILSLSISDSFVLLSRLCFVLLRISEMYFPNETKRFSQYVSSYTLLIINIYLQKVSKIILVQIGAERLLAVWFPLKTKLICSPRKTLVFVISLVCLVSVIFLPIIVDLFVTYSKIISEGGEVYTGMSATMKDLLRYYKHITHVYVTLLLVSRYFFDFFPLVFLAISSCLIVVGIRRSALDMRREGRKNQSKQITKMLLCVCIFFVVLCLPNDFLSVALNAFGVTIPSIYYIFFDIMITTNNAINFIFYCAFHTAYRQQYKRLVMIFCQRKSSKHPFSGPLSTSSFSQPKADTSVSYIETSNTQL